MSRIPCINPACRRTAPAEKYEPGAEIICPKCWRLLPAPLTSHFRDLARRQRRLTRLARKPGRAAQALRLSAMVEAAQERNWQAIRQQFVAPAKPVGLDAFLDEAGFAL